MHAKKAPGTQRFFDLIAPCGHCVKSLRPLRLKSKPTFIGCFYFVNIVGDCFVSKSSALATGALPVTPVTFSFNNNYLFLKKMILLIKILIYFVFC